MNKKTSSSKEKTVDSQVERQAALASRAWKAHRARLYETASQQLSKLVSPEELDVHFATMPARYWQQTDGVALLWHLETIHQFFALLDEPDQPGTTPAVQWRPVPERGVTELALCTWDRPGLLAKVAGVLAASGLHIAQADIYTRADNVVLDIFHVTADGRRRLPTATQLATAVRKLTEALNAREG